MRGLRLSQGTQRNKAFPVSEAVIGLPCNSLEILGRDYLPGPHNLMLTLYILPTTFLKCG